MRRSVLYVTGALIASLLLAACSGGSGTQAVPGGTQSISAPMAHSAHQGHLAPIGLNNNDGDYDGSCTGYLYCYYMYPGTSFSQEWEELDSNGNPIPGKWHWVSPRRAISLSTGRPYNGIVGAGTSKPYGWAPFVGNPSTNTIVMSSNVPSSNGAVQYYMNVSVCSNNSPNGPGYCDQQSPGVPWQIGIVVLATTGT